MNMTELKPPPFLTTAGEILTPFEFTRLAAATPSLIRQKRGNGEPVIVLPGLGTSNVSTLVMRGYLSWLGYDVQGWNLGRNTGNVGELVPPVTEQVSELYALSGAKVNIIGWSLGGVVAREVARDFPHTVQQVITMGTPIVGGPRYTSFGAAYERRGVDVAAIEARIAERAKRPIKVPMTSIYSKRDGIVGWQASIDRHNSQVEHHEVSATHLGLGISPDVFKILAQKLALAGDSVKN